MSLAEGGHLTHGSPVNFSGRYYHFATYGVDPETETHRLRRGGAHRQGAAARSSSWPARAPTRASSTSSAWRAIATRGGRVLHGGHGPHRRPRGRGRAPEPRAACRRRHLHHATRPCAARAAASSSANDEEHRQARSTRPCSPAPRAARSCTSSPARPSAFGEAAAARVQGVHRPGGGERRAPWPGHDGRRLAPRVRRHRQPPVPGGPHARRRHRQGRREAAWRAWASR